MAANLLQPARPAGSCALAAGCVYGFYILWGIGVLRFATESHYLQAILLQTNSRFDDASLQFEEALKSDPHHPESRFYLATDLARRGEYASASKQLDLLLTESPNYPKAGTLSAVCALGAVTPPSRRRCASASHPNWAFTRLPQV